MAFTLVSAEQIKAVNVDAGIDTNDSEYTRTKIDTAANWKADNPIPLNGQLCIESDTTYMKLGDGKTHWNDLSYTKVKETVDDAVTDTSLNPVTSKAIKAYIDQAVAEARANASPFFSKKINVVNEDPERQYMTIDGYSVGYDPKERSGTWETKGALFGAGQESFTYTNDYYIYGNVDDRYTLIGYKTGTINHDKNNPLQFSKITEDHADIIISKAVKNYKSGDKFDMSNLASNHNFTRNGYNIKVLSNAQQEFLNDIKITNLTGAFSYWKSLGEIDVSGWDVSECTDLALAFNECDYLTTITGLEKWNVDNVTNMSGFLKNCPVKADILDLSSWNVSKCKYFSSAFDIFGRVDIVNASIDTLNLSGWGKASGELDSMISSAVKNVILDGPYFKSTTTAKAINSGATTLYVPNSLFAQYKADTVWNSATIKCIEKVISFSNATGYTITLKDGTDTAIAAASDGKYYVPYKETTISVSAVNGTATVSPHIIDISAMKMAEEKVIDLTTLK